MPTRFIEGESTRFVIWEPGNGTRYGCILSDKVSFEDDCDFGSMIAWMRNGGSGGTVMAVRAYQTVDIGYIMEKMHVNEADGAALLALLKKKLGVSVHMPESYDENGCRVCTCAGGC